MAHGSVQSARRFKKPKPKAPLKAYFSGGRRGARMNRHFRKQKYWACVLAYAGLALGQQLPAGFAQKIVAPKAMFLQATSVALTDDGRIFVAERGGNIKVISGDSA